MIRKILFLSMIAAVAASSHGFTILDDEHADIGLGYDTVAGQWDLHVHDETNDQEYAPDEALFYLGTAARESANTVTSSLLGVSSGSTIWRIRETPRSGVVYLGVSTEETGDIFESYTDSDSRLGDIAGTQTGDWVRLQLKSYTGPGQIAVWSSADSGPVTWIKTADGISSSDLLFVRDNAHQHFNYAFSQAGLYTITVEASGLIGGTRSFSEETTYYFGVEAVPEPATMIALGAGAAALIARRRRTR